MVTEEIVQNFLSLYLLASSQYLIWEVWRRKIDLILAVYKNTMLLIKLQLHLHWTYM